MSRGLRRAWPWLLPLVALGGIALAPGPIWPYVGRLALVFFLTAALGWLLAAGARPEVRVLTQAPEAGDFVEMEAVWRSLWPGFWRVTIRDGPAQRVHEGWFGVGRLRLGWAEADVCRGMHVYEVSLTYRDPLGLLTRTLPRRAEIEVAVRPRMVAFAPQILARQGDESLRGLRRAQDEHEFAGVRRYESGDRLSQLHWPQTVRTGQLQVRQTLRSGRQVREILLDTERRDYPDPEIFELAVSVAASFALTLAGQGGRVAFYAGRWSVREAQGTRARLLEALTAVEASDGPLEPPAGRHTLFIGPSEAVRRLKAGSPGAFAVAVGEGQNQGDLAVRNFAQLLRLGRRVRP